MNLDEIKSRLPAEIEIRADERSWSRVSQIFWAGERVGSLELMFRGEKARLTAHRFGIRDYSGDFQSRTYKTIDGLVAAILEHCRPLDSDERASQQRHAALNALRDRRKKAVERFRANWWGAETLLNAVLQNDEKLQADARKTKSIIDECDAELARLRAES